MSLPSFGYAARLQAQSGESRLVRLAGDLFFWGLLAGSLFWWNGLFDPHEAPKQVVFALTMILAGIATGVAMYRHKAGRPFSWGFVGILGALVLSVGISWVIAPDRWMAFFGVAGSISTAASTWLAAIFACVIAGCLAVLGWRPKATPVYFALSIIMLLGWAQRLGWIDVSPGGAAARIFSPFGNELASLWLIAGIVLMALAEECLGEATQKRNILRKIFLFLGSVTLFMIDDRTVWRCFLIGLIVLAAMIGREIRERRTALAMWMAACILALVGLVWTVPQPFGLPRLATLTSAQSWDTVRVAWEQRGMMLGAGLGQWSAVFERIRPIALNEGTLFAIRFDTGGSLFWTILLQQGVIGAIAWVAFTVIAFLRSFSRLREDERRLPLTLAVWLGLGSTFVMQPHGWGMILLFASVGFLFAEERESSDGVRWGWCAGILVCVIALGVATPFLTRRVLADGFLQEAQKITNLTQRHEMMNRAADTAPWLLDESFLATEADAAWLADRLQKTTNNTEDLQQALARAISRSRAASTRWPQSPEIWLAQGGLYAVLAPVTEGADQFAIQAYQRGMEYAPKHPGFSLGMAQIFLRRASSLQQQAQHAKTDDQPSLGQARLEQLRLAAQWFKRALDLKPDDRFVRYAYASTLARAGDLSNAAPIFAALVQHEPDRSDLALEYATILAELGQRSDAIALAQRVGSQDPQFISAQRLLVVWCEAEHRYVDALSAIRNLPLQEQKTAAVRQRINRLQSLVSASGAR